MAGLKLRGNKWYITTRNERGKPTTIATGCGISDRKGAELVLAKYEEDASFDRRDPYRKHRRAAIESHIEDYYQFQLSERITVKQAGEVRGRIERVFEKVGIRRVGDISESKIQTTISKLRQKPRSKKKCEDLMPQLSPRSRNQYRKSCLSFSNWLYGDRRVPEAPLRNLSMEDEQEDVRHPRTALTDQQFAALYSAAAASDRVIEGFDGTARARAYLLSVMTGLRRSELGSLIRKSFAFGADPLVNVEAAFAKNRKRAAIRLPQSIIRDLGWWIRSLDPNEHLFPKLAQRRTCKMIKRDLVAAGIPYQDEEGRYRDWHCLRHSYVTRAWKSGATPDLVQRMARHQDIRTTMRYSHATDEEMRQAVDNIPQIPLIPRTEDAA